MTIAESLRALTNYPIPERTIEKCALFRDLEPTTVIDSRIASDANYQLAKADIYEFLSTAPNVSEGGVSFSLTDKDREAYRRKAQEIKYEGLSTEDKASKSNYGYKGEYL